jgi:aspartyl-tRNA(Asn)/glutamyl-tRNA(Gln) amidotransferase subunit A
MYSAGLFPSEPIETIAARVRAGELDPVLLVQEALTRAERAADLNAVVHLDAAAAIDAARLVARDRRGALAGIPILVCRFVAARPSSRSGSASATPKWSVGPEPRARS